MRIAIAGGTGTVGRYCAETATASGHEVAVLSRSTGVDVVTGAGLDSALEGVDAVIDVTGIVTLSSRKARDFFTRGTTNVLRAEQRSGVKHHVALSIVGIDDIDASYYAGKLAQEKVIEAGRVPFTIARAAQFHEFAGQLLANARGPVAMLPKALIRPVAASDVAERLVSIATSDPKGRAPDFVGPRDENLADLGRAWLARNGKKRRVLEVRLPGRYGAGLASGDLRGTREAETATLDFADWLASIAPPS
ncbi:SDR family oxidoreductase [Leucobacter soli]|uniref:NAD(P)-binding domain-containing protein n=1 Tax=Leucobacter soli TaxID=2812850 RepID=A0A916NMZ8_9MICO|nr:NAD(P)H-binding protein [Leucobacter soli]CAG7609822.1 hypothetical protein LEUCIP111803_01246 [Leucobacter soli]